MDDTGRTLDDLVEGTLLSQVGDGDKLDLAAEGGGQRTLDGIYLGFLPDYSTDTITELEGVECRGVAKKSTDSSGLSVLLAMSS